MGLAGKPQKRVVRRLIFPILHGNFASEAVLVIMQIQLTIFLWYFQWLLPAIKQRAIAGQLYGRPYWEGYNSYCPSTTK